MIIKTYPANKNSIPEILSDIRDFLKKLKKDGNTIAEYELLSEELLIKMIEAAEPDQELKIKYKKRTTESDIIFYCSGKQINLDEKHSDIGTDIILDYSERISQVRKHGLNQITMSTGTSSDNMTVKLAVSGLLAILTAVIFYFTLEDNQIAWLDKQVFYPFLLIFVKLFKGFAVPLTFISLLAYVINFYSSVEFGGKMRRIALKYMDTSLIATVVPFVIVALTRVKIKGDVNNMIGGISLNKERTTYVMGGSLKEFLEGLLPENILDIFNSSNPLPILLIAVLLGLAINSYSGESNNQIRSGVNAIKNLMSNIIAFIYSLLPLFFYVAIVDFSLYEFGIGDLPNVLRNMLLISAMILLTFAVHIIVYLLQIRFSGIRIKDFILKYKDILLENFRIASNIDALPYNMRMLRRKIHDPGKNSLIGHMLNLGANVNMDGNCLIITTTIMIFCFSMNYKINFLFLAELITIIILLGIGSPNQPGSFFIAMLVLTGFLGLSGKLDMFLIIFEGIFLKLYSSINAFGDIVAVVTIVDDELKIKNKT